jgi:hypothetical protein
MFTIDLQLVYPDTYSLGKFVGTEIDVKDMFDSTLLMLLPSLPIVNTYRIKDLERRPDLISYDVYKTTDLAFWLMAYNGIINHEEMATGVLLNLFKKSSFDTLVDRLKLTASADPALATTNSRPSSNPFLAIV